MAQATTTIKQSLQYQPQHGAWFAANQKLFNQVAAFYFSVIQAHEKVLELPSQEALAALEKLTHTTERNPHPVSPLSAIGEDIPALFRRAAIHAALGSAHSFYAHLNKWRARKEQALVKGKQFSERPPVPPRTWNKAATLYASMWKERTKRSLLIKVWTGACWSWLKVRLTGRELPEGTKASSPSLVRHAGRWWLHTPVEKRFATPLKTALQLCHPETKLCAVDLNLDGAIAVCTVQTAEGTILATRFIGGGRAIAGFRKQQLGRIARNRAKTGLLALGEQDNADLWRKINQRDEDFAHQVSHRIVQFAREHGATILVFEHLGNLQPEKGRYSQRGNQKRAFWMKGRIFRYSKYKAWNHAGMITCRVNPKNTSRECAHCGAQVMRYAQGQPEEGYQVGAPLAVCQACKMRGHADRNASINIGRKLLARYQKAPEPKEKTEEKPLAPQPRAERSAKVEGVISSQDASGEKQPSIAKARHGTGNGHGTAHKGKRRRMGQASLSIPPTLRPPME